MYIFTKLPALFLCIISLNNYAQDDFTWQETNEQKESNEKVSGTPDIRHIKLSHNITLNESQNSATQSQSQSQSQSNFGTTVNATTLLTSKSTKPAKSTKKVTYIHTDVLGSPVVETDEQGSVL